MSASRTWYKGVRSQAQAGRKPKAKVSGVDVRVPASEDIAKVVAVVRISGALPPVDGL